MNFAELPNEDELRTFLEQLRPYLEADGYDAALHSVANDTHVTITLAVPPVRSVSQQVLLELALQARLLEEFPSIDKISFRSPEVAVREDEKQE